MLDPTLKIRPMYETPSFYPGPPPAIALTRPAAIDSLNAGPNHVLHVGHGFRFNMSVGDASLVNADADALVNGDRLFNLNLLNCTALAYTYECLAEHFLRNPNGGAVSAVGSNDSAFPNAATYYMEEFYRLLFVDNITHLGELFSRSRLPRTVFAEMSDGVDLWTHYVYTCLGDPEMPLWSNSVEVLSVSHVGSVSKGTNNITVTVTHSAVPVEGATVCLTKGDDDYEVGTTNASGQVTLSFRAESTGTIKVVVTGFDYKRYEGSITVGGTGPYVRLSSMMIDDDLVSRHQRQRQRGRRSGRDGRLRADVPEQRYHDHQRSTRCQVPQQHPRGDRDRQHRQYRHHHRGGGDQGGDRRGAGHVREQHVGRGGGGFRRVCPRQRRRDLARRVQEGSGFALLGVGETAHRRHRDRQRQRHRRRGRAVQALLSREELRHRCVSDG
jgi:hypothetical protein